MKLIKILFLSLCLFSANGQTLEPVTPLQLDVAAELKSSDLLVIWQDGAFKQLGVSYLGIGTTVYQASSPNLSALDFVSSSYGRGLLGLSDAASARNYIGAQIFSPDLEALRLQGTAAYARPIINMNSGTAICSYIGAQRIQGDISAIIAQGTNPWGLKMINLNSALGARNYIGITSDMVFASDLSTPVTVGAKSYRRVVATHTIVGIRASVYCPQVSGTLVTVNIKKNGASILSTKLTIDNNEKTSLTAAIPVVISDTSLADDNELVIFVDSVGDGTATGLIVTMTVQ